MNYTTFSEPAPVQVPDYGDLSRTLDALKHVDAYRKAQEQAKYNQIKDLKTFHQTNTIPKLQRLFGESIQNHIAKRISEVNNGQINPSQESLQRQADLQNEDLRAKAITEALKLKNQEIEHSKKDPYYKPEFDVSKTSRIIPENEEEGNTLNSKNDWMENELNKIKINDPEEVMYNYDQGKQMADFVKNYPLSKHMVENRGESGIGTKNLLESRWWDENDNPDVTPQVIQQYAFSDPRNQRWYLHKAGEQLLGELNALKASGHPNWKYIDPMQEVEKVMEHPEMNTFHRDERGNVVPYSFNDRMRDLMKKDLQQYALGDRETSIDMSSRIPSYAYGVKDKNAQIFEGYDNNKIANVPDGMTLTIRNGKSPNGSYNMTIRPKVLVNTDNGKVSKNVNDIDFSLKNAKIVALDKDGKPIPIKADNIEDFYKAVDLLPKDALKNGSVTWVAEGQSINKKDIASAIDKLQSSADNSDVKNSTLKNLMDGTPLEGTEQAYLQKELGYNIVSNVMLPLNNQSDLNQIKAATNGLDLNSPKVLKGEFKQQKDYLQKKINEATSPAERAVKTYQESPQGEKDLEKSKKEAEQLKEGYLKTKKKYGDKKFNFGNKKMTAMELMHNPNGDNLTEKEFDAAIKKGIITPEE